MGNDERKEPQHYCSICHKPESETGKQFSMFGHHICVDCMQKSMEISQTVDPDKMGEALSNLMQNQRTEQTKVAKDEVQTKHDPQPLRLIPPHELRAKLDEHVIGQEQAKKVISVATYNHYKRIQQPLNDANVYPEVEIEKSNILMIGPTGSGKTHLVKTLAKILDVPLVITDATSLTEAGYVGDDVESVLSKLLTEADGDVSRAEQGIIFIDEIDKLAKKRDHHSRDISGEAVQQSLLKLLEGNLVQVPVGAGNKSFFTPNKTVDTSNILFIVAGAFSGLDTIVAERIKQATRIGFVDDVPEEKKELLKLAQIDDLRQFGMIPEFLGRLPILVLFTELTETAMLDILVKPKNSLLKQYQKLFALDDVTLHIEESALRDICAQALKKGTGARALRAQMEALLLDVMFEVPKDANIGEVWITEDFVKGIGAPRIIMRQHRRNG